MGNQETVLMNPPEVAKKVSTPGYAWVILAVAYLGGVMSVCNLLKVPPLMPILMGNFHVNFGSAGLMMSVVVLVGTAVGLPSGPIVQKLGLRWAGVIAMAFGVAGCAIAALSTSYTGFLIGRALEGACLSLNGVVGNTASGIWFPKERIGLALGIRQTSVGVGGIIAFGVAPKLAQSLGWQGVWWVCAAGSFIVLLIFAIFLRTPPSILAAEAAGQKEPSLKEGFTNRNIWFLAAAICCIYIPVGALMTFYAAYLTKVRGFTLEMAGVANSYSWIGLLIGGLMVGFVIAKLGHLKLIQTVGGLLVCLLLITAFHVEGPMITVWMVLYGIIGMGCIPILYQTAVPAIMVKPQLVASGMAIAMTGLNLAVMIAAPLFGMIVDKAGWNAASYALIPVVLLGMIATRMTKFAE